MITFKNFFKDVPYVNRGIITLDTSSATDMEGMLANTSMTPDLALFNVEKVTNMKVRNLMLVFSTWQIVQCEHQLIASPSVVTNTEHVP